MERQLAEIERNIQELRKQLTKIIQAKGNVYNDPEVITASQMLDAVLNEYNELLLRKIQKPQ